MGNLDLEHIGKKVKILKPHGYHHKNEIGVIEGRDSMPYPGDRHVWFVEARNHGQYYAEEELKLVTSKHLDVELPDGTHICIVNHSIEVLNQPLN